MKKLLIGVLSLMIMGSAFADPMLRIKINGPIKDNRYFLCVSQGGCVSMLAASKGKMFPLNGGGGIHNIIIANLANKSMQPQRLPSSCNVTLDGDKTLTVFGTLVTNGQRAAISNLRCSVS